MVATLRDVTLLTLAAVAILACSAAFVDTSLAKTKAAILQTTVVVTLMVAILLLTAVATPTVATQLLIAVAILEAS